MMRNRKAQRRLMLVSCAYCGSLHEPAEPLALNHACENCRARAQRGARGRAVLTRAGRARRGASELRRTS